MAAWVIEVPGPSIRTARLATGTGVVPSAEWNAIDWCS